MKHIREYLPKLDLENELYEFKQELDPKHVQGWLKSIAAFANSSEGGTIYVGVTDDGFVKGLPPTTIDECKRLIIDNIARYLKPIVNFKIDVMDFEGNHQNYILILSVYPSTSMVKYHIGDYNEIVYVRKDGESVPATPDEIVSFGMQGRFRVFDKEDSKIPFDLSKFSFFAERFKENSEGHPNLQKADLMSADAICTNGDLTNAGMLFEDGFVSDDVAVHCTLWDGFDKGGNHSIDDKMIKGNLLELYDGMKAFVERNTRKGFLKKDDHADSISAYPSIPVHEVLINALAHRDYTITGSQIDLDIFTDRMEVTVPGDFIPARYGYTAPTIEDIGSMRRNQGICQMFWLCGLMQRKGSGFDKIHKVYQDYPREFQPYLTISRNKYQITLMDLTFAKRKELVSEESQIEISLSDEQKKVLANLSSGAKTISELQALSSYAGKSSFRNYVIQPLLDAGLVLRLGNPHSPNLHYGLAKKPDVK
ncbi:MAG: putative DNA binding domain-containing protein [Bacilli bacterium]|jgi:predicted HTH transcriptional regulator|nr:putative DNA binding domain-containing protein [Bacilli bacterium]